MKRKHDRVLKPRNALVADMRFRKSGAHQKTKKALRKAAKVDLGKQMRGIQTDGVATPSL